MIQLDCPQPLFLLSLPLEECLLDELLVSLVRDGRLLLIIEALEVVGLDSVRSQHRLLGGRVLGHEIIFQSEIHLMCLLVGSVLPLPQLGIPLLLGELQVVLLGGTEHVGSLCLMICLSLLQHLVEVDSCASTLDVGATAVLFTSTALLCGLADGGIPRLSIHGPPAVVTVAPLGTAIAIELPIAATCQLQTTLVV